MPTRAASLAVSTAKAVVNSAMPHSTGTRPAATDFAVSMIATFSLRSSEVFSPTEPQTIRPETPSRISPSMTLRGRVDVEREIVVELRGDGREDAFPGNAAAHGFDSK